MIDLRWIFGGVGAVVVGAIVTALLTKPSRSVKQTQSTSGNSSTNIQAGRDVYVQTPWDDKDFAVQPILHLVLNAGAEGQRSYLRGFIRNVGRGIARDVTLSLPGVGEFLVARLIKPMSVETVNLTFPYDDKPAYLEELPDNSVQVSFENEMLARYTQAGTVSHQRGAHSAVFSYSIDHLDPPTLARD
jgi:hypothetical protein